MICQTFQKADFKLIGFAITILDVFNFLITYGIILCRYELIKDLLRLSRSIGDRHRRVRRVNKTRALEIASAAEKRGFTFPVGCLASKSISIENSWSEIRLTRLSHVCVNDYGNVVVNGQFYTVLFSIVTFLVCHTTGKVLI